MMDVVEDRFYKHTILAELMATERRIYERLGSHVRVLRVLSTDPREGLEFEYLPSGCVEDYITAHPDVPFEVILRWITQLAEGIAYLHSKNIVWSDCKLANVLVTNDMDVVLCDFAGSSIDGCPAMVRPSAFYMLPSALRSADRVYPSNQDRFAFGTCVFVLLTQRYPLRMKALSEDFTTYEECNEVGESFKRGEFDALSEEAYPKLAEVIQKCWRDKYKSTEDLVIDVRKGCAACLERYEITDTSKRSKIYGYQPPKALQAPATLLGIREFVLASLVVVTMGLTLHLWMRPENHNLWRSSAQG